MERSKQLLVALINNQKLLSKLFLALAMIIFLILAWKQPYGQNSLIGNFDPYPDSLHYIVPARNLAMGNGFALSREGGIVKIEVPPLYSMTLIPAYLINHDARSFYWSNLILGLLSVFLLYKISTKLSKSAWISGFLLLLYVTNFVIYWQVSLPMAENVLLPVLFAAIYFALQPLKLPNILTTVLLAVACYGSKYVALPITAALILFIIWRIWQEKKQVEAIKIILLVLLVAGMAFFLVNGQQLLFYLRNILEASQGYNPEAKQSVAWLSTNYLSKSLPQYFSALLGAPIYNLWHVKPILPVILPALVLIWSVFAVVKLPKHRSLAILLLGLVFAQLSFLSLISMIEGRYAFTFIPVIFIGAGAMLGWFFDGLKKYFSKTKISVIQLLLVLILASASLLLNFKDLKTQLLVNYKGGETPWWQIGIQATDRYLLSQNYNDEEKPILISSLSPFVWDFYRQTEYQIMPLSSRQSMVKNEIWGENFERNNLLGYYQEEIKAGRAVYLDTVGFGRTEWPILEEYEVAGFKFELIKEECLGACKLYLVQFN